MDDMEEAHERLHKVMRKLDISKEKATEEMLDEEQVIEEVCGWNKQQREEEKTEGAT